MQNLPSSKQIDEIAENLECGFKCFWFPESQRLVSIIDEDPEEYYMNTGEDLQAEIDAIENAEEPYIELIKMSSTQAFQVMEEFTETVDDRILQSKLLDILGRKKPFANFKHQIDNSGPYREAWFQFRRTAFQEWVKEQVDEYNTNQ